MLEILLLIALGKNISAKAKAKGRSAGGCVALLLLLWFGGEIIGAVLGVAISLARNPHEEPELWLAWVLGMIGAAIGAFIAFRIVDAMQSLREEDEWYDDDRPRPRRQTWEDDDDLPSPRDRGKWEDPPPRRDPDRP